VIDLGDCRDPGGAAPNPQPLVSKRRSGYDVGSTTDAPCSHYDALPYSTA